MSQPSGFIDSLCPHHVCRLCRSLYGLKQAPRAWFLRLNSYLLQLGFTGSVADTSLFILRAADYVIFLLVYVDDIIIIDCPHAPFTSILASLHREFAMKDLGSLHYFLGIEVHKNADGLLLTQSKYIHSVLDRTNMLDCKPSSTPVNYGGHLSILDGNPLPDPSVFRQVVWSLQYLTLTRPDIAYAVQHICQLMHQPTTAQWTAVRRILRYLKG